MYMFNSSRHNFIIIHKFSFQKEAPAPVVRVETPRQASLPMDGVILAYMWAEFENDYFDADMAAEIRDAAWVVVASRFELGNIVRVLPLSLSIVFPSIYFHISLSFCFSVSLFLYLFLSGSLSLSLIFLSLSFSARTHTHTKS